LFVQVKRRLLWRVRRKLILSYIFIGVIPSLLILVFFLFAGSLVFMNVSAYLFRDAYEKVMDDAPVSAQAAATAIVRSPAPLRAPRRWYGNRAGVEGVRGAACRGRSVGPLAPDGRRAAAGLGPLLPLPPAAPPWMAAKDVWQGSIGLPIKEAPGEQDLVVRTV